MGNKKTTRNAHGAGTIRKRPNGRWEGRFTAGYDSGTGKQIQKSVYGNTQSEVLKKLREIQVSLEQGTFTEPSKMTTAEWMNIWQSDYFGGIKGETVYSYKGHIKNHINPALGAVKLQKLNPHEIQNFYNNLQRVKNLSAKTVKNIHGVLHCSLKQAVKIGYIRNNPADNITLPRVMKPEISILPEEALPVFLEAIRGHIYESIYYVTLFTGLRKGEVLGLTWDCVNFENGSLYIKQQLQKERKIDGEYLLAPLKNDKPRMLTLADSVLKILSVEKIKQEENKLKIGSAWNNPYNLIFTNEMGRYIAHYTLLKHFKKIVKNLGYPDLRIHDLRHTFAVASLQSGDDIKTVQSNLGHHTASFTLDVYGHVTEKMKKDSAARMERFINNLKTDNS